MTRLKFSEIVVMVLALLGGLVIVFLIGTGLMLAVLGRAHAETGGSAFVISGGLSSRLFTRILIVVLATVVATAVALWRRSKPGRG
jgi:amino acid transporter